MVADHNPGVSFPQLVLGKKSEIGEIAETQNCTVMVEGVVVGYAANFLEAIGIILSTYYVFNIAYPKEIEKSLTFLQKVLLGKHEECKRIPAVLSLISRMNTEV